MKFLFVFLLFFCACYQSDNTALEKTETNKTIITDPIECYKRWTGQSPPSDVKIINGSYWQSSHFTKEYILFLEIEASQLWRSEFIKQNKMVEDTVKWFKIDEAPKWFSPNEKFKIWKLSDELQHSKYFEDSVSGKMFLYEIQL